MRFAASLDNSAGTGYFQLSDYDYTNDNNLKISISATDQDSNDISTLITDIWNTTNSVAKGFVSIVESDGTVTLFKITGNSTSGSSGDNLVYRTFNCLRVYGNQGGATVSDGFGANSFVDMTIFRSANDGAQGPHGVQGIQGPHGIQGIQGPHGIQGIQGPHGIQGIQGPHGIQGQQGPHGIQGIQGPAGTGSISIVTLSGNMAFSTFAGHKGKRILKLTNSTVYSITLSSPSSSEVEGSWIICNASDTKIDLLATGQYVQHLTGFTDQGVKSNWEIDSGGIAEIVCINNTANGGTAASPNYIIFGSGIIDV